MEKYRCLVCGYIYDPAKGDPDNGVQPGTSFDKLPAVLAASVNSLFQFWKYCSYWLLNSFDF